MGRGVGKGGGGREAEEEILAFDGNLDKLSAAAAAAVGFEIRKGERERETGGKGGRKEGGGRHYNLTWSFMDLCRE